MPRRGENIRKRKDGRWEARYKKGYNQAGKAVYGSVYADTYHEVKEKRTQMLRSSSLEKRPVEKAVLFRDVSALWLANNQIRFKGATLHRYHYLVETHILPELGSIPVASITSQKINTFLSEKLRNGRVDGTGGLSSAYVKSIMLIVQSILNFAASQGLCDSLKAKINRPPEVKKELQILSIDSQRKLECVLSDKTDTTKIGILLTLYAGLRIGEVCALTWDDIDFESQVLYVRHTIARVKKAVNGKQQSMLVVDMPKTTTSFRCIPLCARLLHALQDFSKTSMSEYVVSTNNGFLSPRTFEYRYSQLLKWLEIPHINYHALRHTFATRCVEAGVDIKSLSEILGHANVTITLNTYVHSSLESKRSQLEKLSI